MKIVSSQIQEKIQLGEFWTNRQRQSHPIHYSVSYRASFKPELPGFFINMYLPRKGGTVADPFGGRGTTALQANMEGQYAIHNDISPLSIFLAKARNRIPSIETLEKRLASLDLNKNFPEEKEDERLFPFFHPNTINELKNLRSIWQNDQSPEIDYIMFTALTRLHGHSPGFFSVYTFPQISVSPKAQININLKRKQLPEYREIKSRILKKMKKDLAEPLPPFYHEFSLKNLYFNQSSRKISELPDSSVDLVVTSPPFLNKVDYLQDNWLKYWILNLSPSEVKDMAIFNNISDWKSFIHETLKESGRYIKPGGRIVMEVGEVVSGKKVAFLDEEVLKASEGTSLFWDRTFIQTQKFTKLSNCWKINNNVRGTNTNRCIVFVNKK